MRVMLKVRMNTETSNNAIKDGSLPKLMERTMEELKPEAAYFTTDHGRRCAFFVFDMKDPSMLPSIAEPFFMTLGAEIECSPVMNREDLKIGLQKAMERR